MNWHREYSTWGPLASVVSLNAPGPTQGDLLMSITITPCKSALRVRVNVPGTGEGNDQGGAIVLVQDGQLAGFSASLPSNTFFMLTPIDLERVLAVTPSVPTTISVRAGPREPGHFWIGGTWPWSGGLGSPLGGGQSKATLDIEEIDLEDVPEAPLTIVAAMGQSNIDGAANAALFPAFANRDRVHRFDVSNGWGPAFEPWNRDGPLYPVLNEAPNASLGSPILSFADKLVTLTGNEVGVVASTKAGIGINAWGRNLATSSLYGAFIDRTLQALMKAPAGSTLKGVITYIGEADADTASNAYAWGTRYLQFVSDLRSDLGMPNLPCVYVILGPDPMSPAWPYWSTVQSVQAGLTLPTKVGRVDARDLTGAGHLDPASTVEVGRRLAAALAALL
jgi:hypothetical protein